MIPQHARLRPSMRFLRSYAADPWAILPEKLDAIIGMTEAILAGGVSAETIDKVKAAAPEPSRSGAVAVLPLFGTIFPRSSMFGEMSGGTSCEKFSRMFDSAMNDPAVGSIIIDVDSPGGQVAGVPELAERIFAARGAKRIVAIANHQMASAAYWIASAADEVVATPSAYVGSIGVVMVHVDETAALEQEGLKVTLIHAGRLKTVGASEEPLSDEGLGLLQSMVDRTYEKFVGAVAKHRGVKAADVRGGFGEGFIVRADEAKRIGMIDRVETMEKTIERLAPRRSARANAARAAVAYMKSPNPAA